MNETIKTMKHLATLLLVTIGIGIPYNANAQNAKPNSTVNAIKIKSLKAQKESLQKQIAVEDKKRNIVIEGVSAETLEKKNEQQDSICLELRSALVSVELELREYAIRTNNNINN